MRNSNSGKELLQAATGRVQRLDVKKIDINKIRTIWKYFKSFGLIAGVGMFLFGVVYAFAYVTGNTELLVLLNSVLDLAMQFMTNTLKEGVVQ